MTQRGQEMFMSDARRSPEHVAAVCDTAALPCAVIGHDDGGGVYRCVSGSSVWVRWLQSDTMSSKGGGTALTRRNYRLASDMDKPRSTGMNAQSLPHEPIAPALRLVCLSQLSLCQVS